MARKNFTLAIIKARLEHSGHQCEQILADGTRCLIKAEPGRFQCDHDNPDGLTGQPTFENARILCTLCHKRKTAKDIVDISKAKRRDAGELRIQTKTKAKIAAPPSAKSQRVSKPSLPHRSIYGAA